MLRVKGLGSCGVGCLGCRVRFQGCVWSRVWVLVWLRVRFRISQLRILGALCRPDILKCLL